MESVGPVVLIVVTVAIGLAFAVGVVQLWRHQPIPDRSADEETVELPRDDTDDTDEPDEDSVPDDDGEPDEEATVELNDADDEATVELAGRSEPDRRDV